MFSQGGQSWGPRTQVLAPSALGRAAGRRRRCAGVRGPLSGRPVSGSADLEDMSVMVLRTQGPAALFDDHKLVLHTSSYDAERARVFHACGEFVPLPHPVLPAGPQFPHLGLEGRLCPGSRAVLGVRGRTVRCESLGLVIWDSHGLRRFYGINEFEKYILSTFRNFYYQNFRTNTKVERTA